MNWTDCAAVESRKKKLAGTWVFQGTRVPVEALFENLLSEATVHQFTEWFLGVDICQVEVVLQHQISTLRGSPAGGTIDCNR